MSDTIIGAIIGAAGTIIAAFLAAILAKKKGKRLKKNKYGEYILPQPFPCAHCEYELICELNDSNSMAFDFSKVNYSNGQVPFVSMVYHFPEGVALKKYKKLSFELKIDDGNFERVDLEIKKDDGTQSKDPILSIRPENDWKKYEVDLHECVDRDILAKTGEICIVVKSIYATDPQNCHGRFSVRNLAIDGKT